MAFCTAYVAHMDGSSGTALLLWDNRYRTDKNSSVKLSKIIVLKTDLINRVVTEIGKLINTVVIEIENYKDNCDRNNKDNRIRN